MSRFFAAKRVRKPEDVIPFLAKGKRHWRKGYSAYELAYSWVEAEGFPNTVRSLLDSVPEFRNAEIVQAYFEKETDLKTKGRDSQTDLLVQARSPMTDFIIGVEGKVDEPFGELVSAWNTGIPTRVARLGSLCASLELDPGAVDDLRYQLLHRTCAAIYEAQAYGCHHAVMLVHSFSREKRWLDDFRNFCSALSLADNVENQLSSPISRCGVSLRLGWVCDLPR